jgi:hypothetical protein
VTFRDPDRLRWDLALSLLWAVFLILLGTQAPGRFSGELSARATFAVFAAAAGGFLTYRIWQLCTRYVSLDETGVRWRNGNERGGLRWDEIHRMEFIPLGKTSQWGLIEKSGGQFHTLPLMPRKLFLLLKQKCGIPAEAEERFLKKGS